MEFDKNRVYTALNADEVKAGSKVICGDNITLLKRRIKAGDAHIHELTAILEENLATRFRVKDFGDYALCYLVSEPEEKVLKWIDLKIGDIVRDKKNEGITHMITGIDTRTEKFLINKHVFFGGAWVEDDLLKNWEKIEE